MISRSILKTVTDFRFSFGYSFGYSFSSSETNVSKRQKTKTTDFLGNLTCVDYGRQGETGLRRFRKPEVKGSSPFAGSIESRN